MRGVRTSGVIALLAFVVLGAMLASSAAARVATYKGTFLCDDRGHVEPLAGMNVELWERGSPDFLPVEIVGHRVDRGFTDSGGNFSLRTEDNNDNYFVRMALRDAHGVHLRDFWGINDWSVDSAQKRNDVAVRDYGNIVFSTAGQSHKCAIWNGVHKAYERFRTETGTELPTHGVELEADAVTAGVPFTPGTSILWPGGFPVGYSGPGDDSITRHEFGHVIRHSLDGDFGHFLGDVATYNYLQNHEVCNHTNEGFAFNEGWAEFWAEDFAPAPDCGRPGDMATEGNVAAALQELMENCAGGQRPVMVDVLRRNPGTIHSFAQFREKLGCPIPRLHFITVIAAAFPVPQEPPSTPRLQAAIPKDEVRLASKQIRRLRGQLKVALRRADSAPSCEKAPCKAALKAATLPAVLKFELGLARVQRSAAAPFDSAREQTKLAAQSFGSLVKGDARRERRNRGKVVRLGLATTKGILAAARPIFAVDRSKYMRRVHLTLAKAARRFRKAQKGSAALPLSLTLRPIGVKFPHATPKVPAQPATPVPPATVKTTTALTFTACPAAVASGKPIDVAGSLSPPQGGAAVSVTFRGPLGEVVTVPASTGADGSWSASYTPGSSGAWTVDAAYSGDASYAPASAPSCQTKIL
jgi:hypothetical protein